ncbi:HIT-like protein [Gymnopilus junonius]|uniref:HIT-like protein n=1 Tax=Gymnopilus junonius TaxID=109634 RepID=A0A9P5ND83_GYMJU|nr:HIT-like protein [Gymnopilus junonius]
MASYHVDESCIFCLIVQGKIPSFKVFETEKSLAFLDINPVSEGHTLVISKYHGEKILDLPDEYLADIGPILKKVAKAIGAEQFNVIQNNGKMAMQHVDHVHFHIVPKPSPTEGLVINEEVNWPVKKVTKEELAKTAERLISALNEAH